MDLDHWKQLDSLLQSVLERPPEERDAFLLHACAGTRSESMMREIISSNSVIVGRSEIAAWSRV